MKIIIEPKSAAYGLVFGVVAMLLIAAGTSSNPVEKYQITTGFADGKGFAIMVDTQTGQAWGYDYQPNQMTHMGYSSSVDFWKTK